MVRRFRTRPVEVEVVQSFGHNFDEVYEFTEGNFRMRPVGTEELSPGIAPAVLRFFFEVYDELHDTWIKVKHGQFIVRGAKGEYYPCDDETFHWKYEEVTDLNERPGENPTSFTYEDCANNGVHGANLMIGDTCQFCGWERN